MSGEAKWTKARVAELVDKLPGVVSRKDVADLPERLQGDASWGYIEAAAVLCDFDPTALVPPEGMSGDTGVSISELLHVLQPLSSPVDHQGATGVRPRWMLRHEVRQSVLERMKSRSRMLKTLKRQTDRPDSALQRMIEAYLEGVAPPLEEQSPEDLGATLQVSRWLNDVLDGVPAPEEVKRRLDREALLEHFRRLEGGKFAGREKELAKLRKYVGVERAPSMSRKVWSRIEEVTGLSQRPPLLIHGPGGVGKSTLISHFILEYVELARELQFPFVYLDLDDPAVSAGEPATLLVEGARQLGVQFPDSASEWLALRNELREELLQHQERSQRSRSWGESISYSARNMEYYPLPSATVDRFVDEFASIARRVTPDGQPLLWVLDTFEEVQYRRRDYVEILWTFLDRLQERHPRLRAVIAGRSPIEGFEVDSVTLGDFDPKAARAYLSKHGMDDPSLLDEVVARLGGNPLVLQLAAFLLRRSDEELESLDVSRRRHLVFKASATQIQAQLYQRILGHIHDRDVRQLAHPGLVLREITPKIIQEVLAEPCGVEIPDSQRARELWEELGKEAFLVTHAGPSTLRHRADVRTSMLDLIVRDEPERVREIHRRAVAYFEASQEAGARTEELYHRLALGQARELLDERWDPVAGQELAARIDELPLFSQAFLASKLGIERDETVWAAADLADWERKAEQEALAWLGRKEPDRALKILKERKERSPGSRLPLVEARVHLRLDNPESALKILREAESGMKTLADPHELDRMELLAQAELLANRPRRAVVRLRHADELAARRKAWATVVRLKLLLWDAFERIAEEKETEADLVGHEEIERGLLDAYRRFVGEEGGSDTALKRAVAARLGTAYADLLREALVDAPDLRWDEDDRQFLMECLGELREEERASSALRSLPDDLEASIVKGKDQRITELLAMILAERPVGDELRQFLADRLADSGVLEEGDATVS